MKKRLLLLVKSNRIQKLGTVFSLRIVGMLLAYVAMIYISNTYGAATYGRYSISLTLWQFLTLIFSLGLPTSMVKLTADYRFFEKGKLKNNYFINALKATVFSGLICSLILFFSKNWLAVNLFNDIKLLKYIEFLSYFICLGMVYFLLVEFLRGRKLFLSYSLFQNVLPYLILIPLLILFHEWNFSENNTILAYVISISVLSLVLFKYYPKKINTKSNTYSYKKLFQISIPLLFSAAFIFISNWTDIFMLGALVSKKDVGIYNASYKLASLALLAINAINIIVAPKISELFSQNKILEIDNEIRKTTKLITFITVPVVFLLILFSKNLLGLFGEEFVDGRTTLIIISLGFLFNALSGSVGQVLSMTNHQKALRNFTIISAVLNIFLNYLLIKKFGFMGAAFASMVSNVFLNLVCIVYIKRKFNFYTFFRL